MHARVLAAAALVVSVGLIQFLGTVPGNSPGGGDASPAAQNQPPKFVVGDREEITFQNQRYLKVKNTTKVPLTIFLQYRTLVDGVFTWLPTTPMDGAEAISFDLAAGAETLVQVNEAPLAASRVRIWATGDGQQWLAYQSHDLWLVLEKNEEGDHVYAAELVQTFTFTFAVHKADSDDHDAAAGSTYPDEDPATLPDVLPDPGQVLPDGTVMPVIRDLAVLPVTVLGVNAIVQVKNHGHANDNAGRHLFVKRVGPGQLPFDLGPVGSLFHNSIRAFYLVGLPPGNYVAYLDPGDDYPYDDDDFQVFTIAPGAFTDLRVLPVAVLGGQAHIKVKNVGAANTPGGRSIFVHKVGSWTVPTEVGVIGPLPVNGVQAFPPVALAPGVYKAFIAPGDAPPYSGNDSWLFVIPAAGAADLRVLPVAVICGQAHVTVKNIGTAPAKAANLMVVKLKPGSVPLNVGPVGLLAPGASKVFAPFGLPPANYRAFLDPGDPPPFNTNDYDDFAVTGAPFVDLKVLNVGVKGDTVTVKVKNVGTAAAGPGQHLKVVKVPGGMPVDHGAIGPLAPGATKTFAAFKLPAGNYKAYVEPGDPPPHAANDSDDFVVGAGTFVDLEVLDVVVTGDDVAITVKNAGTAAAGPGRHLKVVKLPGGVPIDKGPIGNLAPGATKAFPSFALPPGNYKAYVDPGDPVPYAANDFDLFTVKAAAIPDLGVSPPMKVGNKVTGSITNHGPGAYAGTRTWHLEHQVGMKWVEIAQGTVPNLAPTASTVIQGNFAGPGTYRLRLSGIDSDNTNNVMMKNL